MLWIESNVRFIRSRVKSWIGKIRLCTFIKKVDSKIINIFLVEKIMEKSDLFRHQQSSFEPPIDMVNGHENVKQMAAWYLGIYT